jgi:flavin-dependent dehydrogenase
MVKRDIIIAGGGAAGGIAAWMAVEHGFDVTVVDAKERGAYHPCSGMFPNHSFKGFEEYPIPDSVFERDQVTQRCMSPTIDGLFDAREFGATMGKIILRSKFDAFMLDQAEAHGAEVLDSTRIAKVEISKDQVAMTVEPAAGGESMLLGDVLFLATGTAGFELQKRLGFEVPPTVQSIIGEFECSADYIDQVLSSGAYHYYVNKKLTRIGPFWITGRQDTFNAGMIDYTVSKERFLGAIAKDPRLKPLFSDARPVAPAGRDSPYMTAAIPSAPIKTPYGKRALVLGNAAGLPQCFYYEGVWEARASAKYAIDTLVQLRDGHKPPTAENLAIYKKLLARNLVNRFLRSGRRNSYLFWTAQQDESLWSYFCQTTRTNKQFRELITRAYAADYTEDGEDYDTRAGEAVFATIPTLKKLVYAPLFLKAAAIK